MIRLRDKPHKPRGFELYNSVPCCSNFHIKTRTKGWCIPRNIWTKIGWRGGWCCLKIAKCPLYREWIDGRDEASPEGQEEEGLGALPDIIITHRGQGYSYRSPNDTNCKRETD